MITDTTQTYVDLSIVVPVKDEETSIQAFIDEVVPVCDAMNISYELLFVNDGSQDRTQSILEEARQNLDCVTLVKLSRNFGKEFALSAGIDFCSGRAAIPMDVDLQDPTELIPLLYKKHLEGFDTVVALRRNRDGDTRSKRLMARLFHFTFSKMSEIDTYNGAGDFRIISRRVIDQLRQMPERTRFMKGLLSWPGFSTSSVSYDRPQRASGSTKWSFTKLWRLALDGLFSFSTLPLKIWTYIGSFVALSAVIYMFFTVVKTLVLGVDVPGYASLLSFVLLLGGVNLMGIGILGEYLGRVFIEVKGRPIYIVEESLPARVLDTVDETKQTPSAIQKKSK